MGNAGGERVVLYVQNSWRPHFLFSAVKRKQNVCVSPTPIIYHNLIGKKMPVSDKLTSIYDMKVLMITINHILIQWDIKLPKM